eukprot:4496804-Alexandrium_andersonii.AAC.1
MPRQSGATACLCTKHASLPKQSGGAVSLRMKQCLRTCPRSVRWGGALARAKCFCCCCCRCCRTSSKQD